MTLHPIPSEFPFIFNSVALVDKEKQQARGSNLNGVLKLVLDILVFLTTCIGKGFLKERIGVCRVHLIEKLLIVRVLNNVQLYILD